MTFTFVVFIISITLLFKFSFTREFFRVKILAISADPQLKFSLGYTMSVDMMSLSDDKQADVIDVFNTTSRYLDDILNINNVYFDNMVSQIYPSELQLNKANASDTKAAFLGLHLSISNDIVATKIYDKRDDFDFEIVNFPIFRW